MAMGICIFPITRSFAAEVGDLDLRRPLAPEDMAAVHEAFATYAVLVFPAQDLTAEEHPTFAANFGPLERSLLIAVTSEKRRVREEISDLANMDADGNVWKKDSRMRSFQMMGNRLWHTDSSFKAPSGYASLLYARSIPPIGGHTEFADLRAAFDALPDATRVRLLGLMAEHSLLYSRAKLGFTSFSEAEREAFAPVLRRPFRSPGETPCTSRRMWDALKASGMRRR